MQRNRPSCDGPYGDAFWGVPFGGLGYFDPDSPWYGQTCWNGGDVCSDNWSGWHWGYPRDWEISNHRHPDPPPSCASCRSRCHKYVTVCETIYTNPPTLNCEPTDINFADAEECEAKCVPPKCR